MKTYIYADNAATTRLADEALDAMLPWLRDSYANASQPYSFARSAKKALYESRETIAACIGAHPEEIFFTSGGTEGDNWAIKGAALTHSREGVLVTSAFEHHAVLNAAEAIETMMYPVAYMWPSDVGVIIPETLSEYISDNTKMVSVMTANNELGTIQPIKELCHIAHEHGAIFHTDAVQAVGHIPIDVEKLGVDMLSAYAHKFNGPKGVGFQYIRKGTKILPYANGGSQEYGMRAGTENIAGIVGMATALKLNCDTLEQNDRYVRSLEDRILIKLEQRATLFQRNGAAPYLPGLLSLSFPGMSGEAMLHRLDLLGIEVFTGSACNSVNTVISHVLQAIRLDENVAKGTIRISLGKNNTEAEINTIVTAIGKIVK